MSLYDCDINHKCKILKITADNELKKRLYSFGIIAGSEVEIEKIAPKKSVFEININGTLVAIRDSEAKTIKVVSE